MTESPNAGWTIGAMSGLAERGAGEAGTLPHRRWDFGEP